MVWELDMGGWDWGVEFWVLWLLLPLLEVRRAWSWVLEVAFVTTKGVFVNATGDSSGLSPQGRPHYLRGWEQSWQQAIQTPLSSSDL